MPEKAKVPPQLCHWQYGGPTTAAQMRKTNFALIGRRFLESLGERIGVHGHVEVVPGARHESGTARLVADRLVLEISEPPQDRTGLQLSYFICDASHEPVSQIERERLSALQPDGAVDDFVWRLQKLLESSTSIQCDAAGGQAALFS